MKATKLTIILIIIALSVYNFQLSAQEVIINPISHGTLVLEYDNTVIYIDPVGGKDVFSKYKAADFVLITDIHGDHLNIKTLEDLNLNNTTLIAPKAVTERLPKSIAKTIVTINNGNTYNPKELSVEAIPMYNLREEALKFHTKGRGNGYVITLGSDRIYISGDTEDIPEMRTLKNIDIAFICMNLPYTMTEKSAANAVLEFKPKKVYPYHYRGTNGLSDVEMFKTLVNKGNSDIKVVLANWY
ncbi:MBL fold metallo-hydrolase [Flavobacteriaceae bacterium AU392]|nr:MBL fold metallo-hydrolase [Flavobacteriaceae bacterium]RKM85446.1 MBL fold metallo-hydrolase [Flavobacteriaceae bacterium AU392]